MPQAHRRPPRPVTPLLASLLIAAATMAAVAGCGPRGDRGRDDRSHQDEPPNVRPNPDHTAPPRQPTY